MTFYSQSSLKLIIINLICLFNHIIANAEVLKISYLFHKQYPLAGKLQDTKIDSIVCCSFEKVALFIHQRGI